MARWFLWRKQRAYNAIETAVYAAEPNQANWSKETYHQLALAERYRTGAERTLKRALSNLDGLPTKAPVCCASKGGKPLTNSTGDVSIAGAAPPDRRAT